MVSDQPLAMSLFDELTAATKAARAAKKATCAPIISKLTDDDTFFRKNLLGYFKKAADSGHDMCEVKCYVGTFMKYEGDEEPTEGILTKEEYAMMGDRNFAAVCRLLKEKLDINCEVIPYLECNDDDEHWFCIEFSWKNALKKRKRLE